MLKKMFETWRRYIWRKTEGNKTILSKLGSEDTGGSVEKMKTKWWKKLRSHVSVNFLILNMYL